LKIFVGRNFSIHSFLANTDTLEKIPQLSEAQQDDGEVEEKHI